MIPSPASASLWPPDPTSTSLRITAPPAGLHTPVESLRDDTDGASPQHRRTDASPALPSPLAQSWPTWPSAAAQQGTVGALSARALSEDDSDFDMDQRLAAARREALMHLRLQCLQDIVAMLEQHVFEEVPTAQSQ